MIVNATNPFQIPPCLQRADLQLRRQKRFQKIVVFSVAAVAALLVVLLIEGCMAEHSKASTDNSTPIPEKPAEKPSSKVAITETKLALTLPSKPIAPLAVVPAVSKQSAPSAVSAPESIYVVKAGDNLTRIAKLHRTTVKEIKVLNGLNRDTLAVGMKLKVPTA
jgi:peptidoglycan endopeptidase LytE